MFELLGLLFLIGIGWVVLKTLGIALEAGAFLLAIPFKIIGAIIGLVFGIIFLPFTIIGALFSLLEPLLIIGVVGLGLYFLLK